MKPGKRVTIAGYTFRIHEDGVFVQGEINLVSPGFMDASMEAIQIHSDKYVNRASYIYVFKGKIQDTYKIGMSYDPETRIKDCYNATEILSIVKVGNRSLTFRYEAALHCYYRNCNAQKYGKRLSSDEWFVMTPLMVETLTACETPEDFTRLMGIHSHYSDAIKNSRPFDPTRYTKPVHRWYKVEQLMLHYNRMLDILNKAPWGDSPFKSVAPFQNNMAGLISEATEYDE